MDRATGRRALPTSAEIDAAKMVLARMGIRPEDLLKQSNTNDTAVPTFADYIPTVAATVTPATRATYGTYWDRIVRHWGARHLDQPSPSEVKQLAEEIKKTVVVRSNARNGRGAVESFITSLRCIYRHAIADGLIDKEKDPSIKVRKPTRLPSTRHALPSERLAEINHLAATTGNDPQLDTLLLRFHTETAGRRGGALALRYPHDIDTDQCLVRLHEKGDTVRWQPVSLTLMTHLQAHAEVRHAQPGEQLFRYLNGRPISSRRYDYLWSRLGRHLSWVDAQQVSTHWLRHTTLTWVERNFSYAIARAYAGHTDSSGSIGTTATYVRADIRDIATALSALTGEPHPLALRGPEPQI